MHSRDIGRIVHQLRASLSVEESAAGWTETSKKGLLPFFQKLLDDVGTGREIQYVGIARSLDAWGIEGGDLYNRIIEVAARLNREATCWTADQIAAADAKVQFLNEADTVVTSVNRGGFAARSTFTNAGGILSPTQDVDHLLDLQLGGRNTLSNLWSLDSSVNRSLGAQIKQQIQGLSPGTVINNVSIGPR